MIFSTEQLRIQTLTKVYRKYDKYHLLSDENLINRNMFNSKSYE